jgi:hypothetical protein
MSVPKTGWRWWLPTRRAMVDPSISDSDIALCVLPVAVALVVPGVLFVSDNVSW